MHWLPVIDIAISSDAGHFFADMILIGQTTGRFEIDSGRRYVAGEEIVGANFRCREGGVHEDLGFQLISRSRHPDRTEVEIRAARWDPDPPDRATYVEAARSLLMPLLKHYNQIKGTRLRLRIERHSGHLFRPTQRSLDLFERFASLANKTSLHPLDWKRFYALVRDGRQEIPEHDIRLWLHGHGFAPEKACELAELYAHLWAFKQPA